MATKFKIGDKVALTSIGKRVATLGGVEAFYKTRDKRRLIKGTIVDYHNRGGWIVKLDEPEGFWCGSHGEGHNSFFNHHLRKLRKRDAR